MSTREERMQRIEAAVYRTITDADWAVSLRRARGLGNAVSVQIRKKILAVRLGVSTSGTTGKWPTEHTEHTEKT